jgi:large conductance mechanosensitive channel
MYGNFLNVLIAFLIIAAVIFFLVVKPMNHLRDLRRPADPEATVRDCPECLSEIPVKATRCKFCSAVIKPKK